jgi:porin
MNVGDIPTMRRSICALMLVAAAPAYAGEAQPADEGAPPAAEAPKGFWEQDRLTGDWRGLRSDLADSGVHLNAEYIGDGLANVSGGLRRGAVYQGRFEVSAELELEKLAGLPGATIFANAYQIHGRGLTAEHLGNLLPTSNIEAVPSTRLFTAWFQQNWLDDRLSLRVGQLAADDEFIISDTAGTFVNGTFGWLALAANNLPSGGPAYPLAAPGVRFAAKPAENFTFRTAVFGGDPAGRPGDEDPQRHNSSGTTFSLEGGTFVISELEYAAKLGGLPGTYKVGGWYHSGSFDDLRRDALGLSLADPASSGVPARHRGNHGIYGVADQAVYREEGSEEKGLNLFMRIGGAPSDRNPVDFYIDGGAAYKGLIPGRDADTIGIAAGYAHVSDDLQDLDADRNAFTGGNGPIEDAETVLEITYIAQVTPWCSLQPDVQLVFQPGGNVPDPSDPTGTSAVPDAVVLGVRTTVAF